MDRKGPSRAARQHPASVRKSRVQLMHFLSRGAILSAFFVSVWILWSTASLYVAPPAHQARSFAGAGHGVAVASLPVNTAIEPVRTGPAGTQLPPAQPAPASPATPINPPPPAVPAAPSAPAAPAASRPAPRPLPDGARFGQGSSEDFDTMFPVRFQPSKAYDEAFERQRQRQLSASQTGGQGLKYVVCSPGAQLGNRLRFVVACFALALATERVLVVTMKQGYHAGLADIFDLANFPLDSDKFSGVPGGGVTLSFPSSNNRLTCTDVRRWTEGAIRASGAYYFMPHLYYNPHMKPIFQKLFPEAKMAERIQRSLLRPHPEVMKIVKKEYDRLKMGDASWLVALQIRGNKPPAPQFWISPPEFKSFDQCATELAPEANRDAIRHFWACDSGLAITETMRSVLGKSGRGLHRWEPSEFVKSGTVLGVRNALADILLQAKCDDLLICAWSSYGQVAAAYHMAPSYMVTDFDKPSGWDYANQGTVVPLCYKTGTTEYSVREWGQWSKRLRCYEPSMTEEYPGMQWSTP